MGVSSYYPRSPRRKSEKAKRVDLFIGGPEPVIDAFIQFREREGHTSYWAALQDLMRSAGVIGYDPVPELQTVMNSRDFVTQIRQAKEAAQVEPVMVLEHNRPAYVFMTHDEFRKLEKFRLSILDAVKEEKE